MLAAYTDSLLLETPDGVAFDLTRTRQVSPTGASLGTFTSQTETVTLGGLPFVETYTAATRTFETTTPEGRLTRRTIDGQGRTTELAVVDDAGIPVFFPVELLYDTEGRLEHVVQGTGPLERRTTFAYDPGTGWLASVTAQVAPAPQVVTIDLRDGAGRVTQVTTGAGSVALGYDPNGNLASLTPPGRSVHGFQHTAVDLADVYTPPTVPGVTAPQTDFAYNLDRQLELVTRPDAAMLDPVYDPDSGRLVSLVQTRPGQPAAITSFGYDDFLRVAEEEVVGVDPAGGLLFAYDGDGLLTAAGALAIARHPDHGLVDLTTPGVVTTDPEANAFGEVASRGARVSRSSGPASGRA
jgi:YD repeat-containing protein